MGLFPNLFGWFIPFLIFGVLIARESISELVVAMCLCIGTYTLAARSPQRAFEGLKTLVITAPFALVIVCSLGSFGSMWSLAGKTIAVGLSLSTYSLLLTIPDVIRTARQMLGPLERRGILKASTAIFPLVLIARLPVAVSVHHRLIVDTHRARGTKPRIRTVIPLLISRTLRDARELLEALSARGL